MNTTGAVIARAWNASSTLLNGPMPPSCCVV
jgi:hypothetical protein